jgi:DNA-binding LytR/AlgR family response regulator
VTDIKHAETPAIGSRRETRFRVLDADRIAVCWGSSTELIAWSEVVSVHAVRNYSAIIVCGRTLKVRSTLRAVVAELAALGLMQVRRDAAVNVTRVRRLIGGGRHRLLVILDDDRRIEVGREFQRPVRARLAPNPIVRSSPNATRRGTGEIGSPDRRPL